MASSVALGIPGTQTEGGLSRQTHEGLKICIIFILFAGFKIVSKKKKKIELVSKGAYYRILGPSEVSRYSDYQRQDLGSTVVMAVR